MQTALQLQLLPQRCDEVAKARDSRASQAKFGGWRSVSGVVRELSPREPEGERRAQNERYAARPAALAVAYRSRNDKAVRGWNDVAERESFRVFISYARRDASAFADELLCGLELAGFEAFLDRHDIEAAVDWEARLSGLIHSADTVVFVITPEAVSSSRCAWEVERAEALSKRVIPVVLIDVPEEQTPLGLKRLNYIFFNKGTFTPALTELVRALRIDVEWIREHTRLADLARRWQDRGKNDVYLLRGPELAGARAWLAAWKDPAPEPTDLHRAFIAASEAGESEVLKEERERLRRQARLQRFAAIATLLLLGVTLIGGWLVVDGRRNLNEATARVLTHFAFQAFDSGDNVRGMRFALLATQPHFMSEIPDDALDALEANANASRMLVEMVGHAGQVRYAQFFANDTRVLSLGEDGTARIWDTANGAQLAALHYPGATIRSASLSKDEHFVLTNGSDGTARVWRSDNGAAFGRAINYGAPPATTVLRFAGGSDRIITHSRNNDSIRIWDIAAARQIGNVIPAPGYPGFSIDGSLIAIVPGGMFGKEVQVWNGRTGESVGEPIAFQDGITFVSFSDDGRNVLVLADGGVTVRDRSTGEQVRQIPALAERRSSTFGRDNLLQFAPGHGRVTSYVSGVAFNLPSSYPDRASVVRALMRDDGRQLLIAGRTSLQAFDAASAVKWTYNVDEVAGAALNEDKSVAVVWGSGGAELVNAETGRSLGALFYQTSPILGATFSKDSHRVLTWAGDGHIRIWNAVPQEVKQLATESVNNAVFSNNGRTLITQTSHELRIWDALSGASVSTMPTEAWIDHLVMPAAGGQFAAASYDKVAIRNQATGAELFTAPSRQIAFSRDGRVLVTADDTAIQRRNALTGAPIGPPLPADEVGRVLISGNADRVLATEGNVAHLWRGSSSKAETVEVRAPNSAHGEDYQVFSRVELSRDGATAFLADSEGTVRIWQPPGALSDRQNSDQGAVSTADFSPDGKHVLIRRVTGAVQVLDVATRAMQLVQAAGVENAEWTQAGDRFLTQSGTLGVNQFTPSGDPFGAHVRHNGLSLAHYSSDGARILTLDSAGVRVWSAATGRQLGPLVALAGVDSAIFSPDGQRIAAWSDSQIYIAAIGWTRPRDLGRERGDVCGRMLVSGTIDGRVAPAQAAFRWPWGTRALRISAHHVSDADIDFAPILRGHEGEDVCAGLRTH